MAENDLSDHELLILENIQARPDHVRQRDLARIVGLSLGMTNAIVKRLTQKGWLTIRKVNNRNIRYIVSSEGFEQIARRSYGYLRRTIKNVVYYRELIEQLVRDAKASGYSVVSLVGKSDVDFIVEHACGRSGVGFSVATNAPGSSAGGQGGAFLLFAEDVAPSNSRATAKGVAYLQEVLSDQANLPDLFRVTG